MTTLEMDCGLTADNVPVLYHDRVFRAELPGETGGKSRRKLGGDSARADPRRDARRAFRTRSIRS